MRSRSPIEVQMGLPLSLGLSFGFKGTKERNKKLEMGLPSCFKGTIHDK
jgi:hypothetical protein